MKGRYPALPEDLDDDEITDHSLEETHRKLKQLGKGGRTLSTGVSDLNSGNVNKLVLEFISKLRPSQHHTKRNNIEEEDNGVYGYREEDKENKTKKKQGKTRKKSVTKRIRSALVRHETL